MKKIINFSILNFLLLTSCFVSSKKSNGSFELNLISDDSLISNILDFDFDYKQQTPGAFMTWHNMWDGTDPQGMSVPLFNASNRIFNTCEFEYLQNTSFYFVYAEENEVLSAIEALTDFEKTNSISYADYKFTSCVEKNVVDGKFLNAIRNSKYENFKIYEGKSQFMAPYRIDDYVMVFSCKSKYIKIHNNLSTKENLSHKKRFFSRNIIAFNEKSRSFEEFTFESQNEKLVKKCEDIFNYVGNRLEVVQKDFLSFDCFYSPTVGYRGNVTSVVRANIFEIDGIKLVELPRYFEVNGMKYDYLDETLNTSDLFLNKQVSDVYQEYKDEFRKAWYSDCNESYNALFLFSAVSNTIC